MHSATTRKILLFVVLVFASVCLLIRRLDNKFAIENRTSKTIARVQVNVCQLSYTFMDVAAGETVWADHEAVGDSNYSITGTLQDGTKVFGSDGYVSNGFVGMRDVLIVRPNGKVEVNQSEIFP